VTDKIYNLIDFQILLNINYLYIVDNLHCSFCINLAYVDSDSEESDSDMSDVAEVDSDIEAERQINYERAVYKEDMAIIKKKIKEDKSVGLKRKPAPNEGLKLSFIHG